MNGNSIYRALTYVSDSYLESAAEAIAQGKGVARRAGRKYIVAAACIALAFLVGFYPTLRVLVFSANEAAAVFGRESESGTVVYTKVCVPDSSFLPTETLPDGIWLPIYVKNNLGLPFAGAGDVDEAFERLSAALGDAGVAEVLSFDTHDVISVTTTVREGLTLDGVGLTLDGSVSDAALNASLAPFRDVLFGLLGVDFAMTRIQRTYYGYGSAEADGLRVYYYDSLSRHVDTGVQGDHVVLGLDEIGGEQYLSLRYVRFRTHTYRHIASKAMISVEEAARLLSEGYVFGGHGCELCMAQQREVDFSTYDHVSLEYVFGAGEGLGASLGVPFYAFYKYLGDGENGNEIYAKAYVPAVRVVGLGAYWEKQKQSHDAATDLDERVEALEDLLDPQ